MALPTTTWVGDELLPGYRYLSTPDGTPIVTSDGEYIWVVDDLDPWQADSLPTTVWDSE